MGTYELIKKRRTIRKFQQKKIDRDTLLKMVEAARLAPSASNMQPLKYIIIDDSSKAEQVFAHLKWAAHIAPEGTPGEGEKPVAYIIILVDKEIRGSGYEIDIGAASQNIILTALEEGIGSCLFGAIDREGLRKALNIPERYLINNVVALGYPAESPVAEEENGSIKYYKDENGVLHVPKRKLEDIILKLE